MKHHHLRATFSRSRLRTAVTSFLALTLASIGLLVSAGPANAGLSLSFPVAVIDTSSTLVKVGSIVSFDGSRSFGLELSVVQTWDWTFDDGSVASAVSTEHRFDTPGMHTITLTVTDQHGVTDDATALVYAWDYPIAKVTASPASGNGPLTVQFDASGSTATAGLTITAHRWDFGDGGTASGPTATHTYTTPGAYLASVSITDSLGMGSTAYQTIAVTQDMRAPKNLAATSPAKRKVVLTWTNRMTAVHQIEVQRCAGTGCTAFVTVALVPTNATLTFDKPVKSGSSQRYRLKITDIVGVIGYSNVATITVR